ncbi:MAG: HEAT repeat domain-containing protein [Candidatus Eisenbacteria bacterium]|nr:HEAT repeat domain-containing protein [Candidatus Eisenbacteria bacterium]
MSRLIPAALLCLQATTAAGQQGLPMKDLFDRATSGEPKFEGLRKEAREEMVRRKEEALPYLFSKLGTRDATERHAIKDIFLQMGESGIPYLLQGLKLKDWRSLIEVAFIIEEMKEKRGAPALTAIVANDNWRVRQAAISAIGEIGDSSFADVLLPSLSDGNELVRKAGAYALGQLKWKTRPEVLLPLLGDSFYGVRYSASFALSKSGAEETRSLINSFKKKSDKLARYHLIDAIGETQTDDAFAFLISITGDTDPLVRAFAVRMLANYQDKPEAMDAIKKLALEKDLVVRSEALTALQKAGPEE